MRKKKRPFDVGVVYGDMHDPYVDEPVFGMFLEALKLIKPNFIIENGDGFDMYQLSKFSKDPRRALELGDDREVFRERRSSINKAAGKNCLKDYLDGNHELRLQEYLKVKAPELAYLDELETGRFLGLDKLGWTYHPSNDKQLPVVSVGLLDIFHGNRTNQYAHKSTLEDLGGSVMINHTHRMGAFWRTDAKTTHVAYMNGHLFDQSKATYAQTRKWQQGFSVVQVDPKTGWFRVSQIPIIKVPGTNKKRLMLHEVVLECAG